MKEQERKARVARRQEERERAKEILTKDSLPAITVSIELKPGETAYYRTAASLLSDAGDGSFQRLSTGELYVTNFGAYYVEAGRVARFHRIQEIERIDIPYTDVIVFISFRDTLTRDEERVYYQLPEPLVTAAHLARYTAFELILD